MTRAVHVVSLLALIIVPAAGWFTHGWSGATTLVVYWFETAAAILFNLARIATHRHWSPRRGHFRYNAAGAGQPRRATFLGGFALIGLSFTAAHGLFLAVLVFLLNHNNVGYLAELHWRSVGFGCLNALVFLTVDFLVDLLTLRHWSFLQLEQNANQTIGRVMVVHLTLVVGFVAVAATSAPDAFFGVFVGLKSLAALSSAVPQWEPTSPPQWLSNIMNRVPNVHPGERFEDVWAADRDKERRRRAGNEQPWVARSR